MAIRYRFGDETHAAKPGIGVVHTACLPSHVTFEGAAATVGSKTGVAASYEARDGALFVIEKAPGGYRIDVRQKERIR